MPNDADNMVCPECGQLHVITIEDRLHATEALRAQVVHELAVNRLDIQKITQAPWWQFWYRSLRGQHLQGLEMLEDTYNQTLTAMDAEIDRLKKHLQAP